MDYKSNQRSPGKDNVSIDEEVQYLFKNANGVNTKTQLQNLKMKYGDDKLAEKIHQEFLKKYNHIVKKATTFAERIKEKYGNAQHPLSDILEKAGKYKKKYHLSDIEFAEFHRIYESQLTGKNIDMLVPENNIQKLLGTITTDNQGFKKNLEPDEYKVLQDILKLNAASKSLYSQVFLQSAQYQDCAIEALTGEYKKDLHVVSNHVHPVIAAMFLPKINILEQFFLHSNISNIIRTRYNKEQFSNYGDLLLYNAMLNDPNDIACDPKSTMQDLYNRAQLQVQLWTSVLSLRNGQYYNNSFREFITAIDTCKMNKYDVPNLVYGRSDAVILKRLLAAFSFAPTVIATMPVYNIVTINPYQQNIAPVITNVPMINLKLPFAVNNTEPIELNSALEQTQLVLENGFVMQKQTALIYSRGVLFFYVDRRSQLIIKTNKPLLDFRMPTAIGTSPLGNLERLNTRPVNFEPTIKIKNDTYKLRSVVVSDVNNIGNDSEIIVGSSAIFMNHIDYNINRTENEYFIYDPYSVAKPVLVNNQYVKYQPIQTIAGVGMTQDELGFVEIARTRGVIFMYELQEDKSQGILVF